VCDCQTTLLQLTGKRPNLFRAPFGHFRRDLAKFDTLDGIRSLVHWDIMPPFAETKPSLIGDYILNRARSGSIIVLHDGLAGAPETLSYAVGYAAAACLESIIPALRARGLRFLTVSEQLEQYQNLIN
jgi:peptidoglycan/xylan/chitin deacetylase (PgdA/CDA1 family)